MTVTDLQVANNRTRTVMQPWSTTMSVYFILKYRCSRQRDTEFLHLSCHLHCYKHLLMLQTTRIKSALSCIRCEFVEQELRTVTIILSFIWELALIVTPNSGHQNSNVLWTRAVHTSNREPFEWRLVPSSLLLLLLLILFRFLPHYHDHPCTKRYDWKD